MTVREASRSVRPPKLLHPSPTSDTWRPDFPRLRCFIVHSSQSVSPKCFGSDNRQEQGSDGSSIRVLQTFLARSSLSSSHISQSSQLRSMSSLNNSRAPKFRTFTSIMDEEFYVK